MAELRARRLPIPKRTSGDASAHAPRRPATGAKRWKRGLTCGTLLAWSLLSSRDASAQLHWDASAQIGATKRFLGSRPAGGSDAGVGPSAQLTAHVALFPLVHLGGYFGHDISPLGGDRGARDMTFGGVRAKAMLPWVRGSTRAWLFAGFGYTGVYSRSYRTTLSVANGDGSLEPRPVRIEGAGGGFFDVPFGLGASYRFFKPWELCAELGGRFGFGHQGSAYEHPGPSITGSSAAENASPAGLDRLAIGLALGILVDL